MKEIISSSRMLIWSGYMLLTNTQRNDPGSDIVIKIAYTEVVESNLFIYLDILQELYYYNFALHPVTLHTNLMRTNSKLIVIKTKNKCI